VSHRRGFLALAAAVLLSAATALDASTAKRFIVLGFDGMDHELTRRLMAEGRMPNFVRLATAGRFTPLGTSVPPQSPVAWSNFITGMDAGGHGIFDFIHRDPKTMLPYLSTSETKGSEKNLRLFKWQIPLSGGKVELLRKGTPFWDVLEAHGVRTTVSRIPANFPPSGSATRELSGMGTPDLLGTYGTFAFYTSNPAALAKKVSGGRVYEVHPEDNLVTARLFGPANPFRVDKAKVTSEFRVHLDPVEPVAKLVVGDAERVLQEGEWSDWIPVEFPLVPTQALAGMCRFYLQSVRPDFKLYVTPINIDPMRPALPISTPDDFAAELARATGRFYTQGMPEDTKALSEGVLDAGEFLVQARHAGSEVSRQYHHVLAQFQDGLLFYYFGNNDLTGHMMWRSTDPSHPGYQAERDARFAQVIEDLYVEIDGIVGDTLKAMTGETTLVIMSDHGFTSWKRAFHLNTWLLDNGYLALRDPTRRDDTGIFTNVDWVRTRAYGLGINGLYVNLKGRERWGTVDPADRSKLMEEIAEKLLAFKDPKTGEPAITKMYRREQVFKDRGYLEIGPDLVVGYAKGTRGSNESALGQTPREVIADNLDPWSGDHCMDHEAVPGILLTSRPLKRPAARLQDLAASILAEFGIDGFPPSQVPASPPAQP
jgi:predicted AlkP superfamily phosphohydrolase/phosphomutase